jgi:hypothetical protein
MKFDGLVLGLGTFDSDYGGYDWLCISVTVLLCTDAVGPMGKRD